jgi:hypothetical protein
MKRYLLIFTVLLSVCAKSQTPFNIVYSLFNPELNHHETSAAIRTPEGYAIASCTNGHQEVENYIVLTKINEEGNYLSHKLVWGSFIMQPGSMNNTIDGGFLLTAYAANNDSATFGSSSTIFKFNRETEIEWRRDVYQKINSYGTTLFETVETKQGYITAGRDVYYHDTPEHTYIGADSVRIITTTENGEITGDHDIGLMETGAISSVKIIATPDSGFLLSVTIYGVDIDMNTQLIKLDSSYSIKWIRSYIAASSPTDICITKDNCILAGITNEVSKGSRNSFSSIKKLSLGGDTLWNKVIDSAFSISSIASDTAGYLYVTGREYRTLYPVDPYIVKLRPDGNRIWEQDYLTHVIPEGFTNRYQSFVDLIPGKNGSLFAAGLITYADIYIPDPFFNFHRIMLIDSLGNTESPGNTILPYSRPEKENNAQMALYPIPADKDFKIVLPELMTGKNYMLNIYNYAGIIQEQRIIKNCEQSLEVDCTGWGTGNYLVVLYSGKTIMASTRIIVY